VSGDPDISCHDKPYIPTEGPTNTRITVRTQVLGFDSGLEGITVDIFPQGDWFANPGMAPLLSGTTDASGEVLIDLVPTNQKLVYRTWRQSDDTNTHLVSGNNIDILIPADEAQQAPPTTPAPAPLAPPDPEASARARELLAAVEAKLSAAKTVRARSRSSIGPPDQRSELVSVLLLGPGDRVSLLMQGTAQEVPVTLQVVSDGETRVTFQASGRSQRNVDPAAPGLGALGRRALAKLSSTVLLRRDVLADPSIPTGNVVLGPKVEEDGRTLQVVEYDSIAPDLQMHVRLWIDTATQLPARCVIGDASHPQAQVEVYESIELDVELPEGSFALPEEK